MGIGPSNVHLQVGHGDKVALVGPNGAGKSTLLLQLNGILQGEGEVHIGDVPLMKDNLNPIRAMVGLVFQTPDDQFFIPPCSKMLHTAQSIRGLICSQIQQQGQ